MAQDRPRGLEAKGEPMRINKYQAGSEVFPGDLVTRAADGQVDAYVAGSAVRPLGVALSKADAAGDDVIVSDHPDQQYIVQADDASVSAQTDIGLNYEIVDTAGDSSFNQIRHELDGSSGAATATLPLRLIAKRDSDDNELGEANVDLIVRINEAQEEDADAV